MNAADGSFATHQVENQPPPLVDFDAWQSDPALVEAVAREGGQSWEDALQSYGLPVNDWKNYDAYIDAVTQADLQRFAREHFTPGKRVRLLAGAVG